MHTFAFEKELQIAEIDLLLRAIEDREIISSRETDNQGRLGTNVLGDWKSQLENRRKGYLAARDAFNGA